MTSGIKTVIYPVKDLAKAKSFYSTLIGEAPYADSPYYVGFKVGEQDIGLDPNGHQQGLTGPLGFLHVDDIEKKLAQLSSAGAVTVQEIRPVGGGRRIASVKDADGNLIGLLQDG